MLLTTDPTFDQALDSVCQRLRGALTELLSEAGGSVESPTVLAKQLKLNKTLAWRASKIVTATNARAVLEFLPAGGSLEILLEACANAGSSASVVAGARDAIAALNKVVRTHAGDRDTFDLMLASMGAESGGGVAALMEGRKLAYMGNSATWGIQAQTRFAAYFIAPSEGEAGKRGQLDIATLGGLIGARRLRADTSVPLFLPFTYNDDGSSRRGVFGETVDVPGAGPLDLPLIRQFCSDGAESLAVYPLTDTSLRYDLLPGPIGNTALMTWVFGYWDRQSVNMYRDDSNQTAMVSTRNFVPAETTLCDLFVHKDVAMGSLPEGVLVGQLGGMLPLPGLADRDRLPMPEVVESLGRFPPSVATPAIPRYTEMVRTVYERCSWNASDFTGFRLSLKYAPLPASVMMRYRLAERP